MSVILKLTKKTMALFCTPPLNHDQDPTLEAKEGAPIEIDYEHPIEAGLDNPSQRPHLGATVRLPEVAREPSQRTRSDLKMMARQYGRLKEHYKTVSQERDGLKSRVQAMEDYISQHNGDLHRSQSTVNTLQDQFAATRAELIQARQDLQASRSFFSTEASNDGRTLVDMLSVLNQKIDDFAYVAGDLIPQQIGDACFTPPKTEQGLADMGPLGSLGLFATQTDLSIADVLQYGIQHIICKCLLDVVFMPFAPAIDRSLSGHLNELHTSLCLHYPQAHSARWRAMTYSHTRPKSIECSELARRWVEQILAFVNLCAPGHHPGNDALPLNLLEKAKEVFGAALALQDKARIAYLAYDYEVSAVEVGSRFKDQEMNYGGDDRKKDKGHGEVVAVLGLGLRARRSVCGDEQYVREEVIPVPVRVSVLTSP